jgi:hypothetical protein
MLSSPSMEPLESVVTPFVKSETVRSSVTWTASMFIFPSASATSALFGCNKPGVRQVKYSCTKKGRCPADEDSLESEKHFPSKPGVKEEDREEEASAPLFSESMLFESSLVRLSLVVASETPGVINSNTDRNRTVMMPNPTCEGCR